MDAELLPEYNEVSPMENGSLLKQKIVDSSSLIENSMEHDNQALKNASDPTTDTSMLLGMIYLKKKRERQLRPRKLVVPPPNFHRMKKGKQQKEYLAQKKEASRENEEALERQEQQKRIATPQLRFEFPGVLKTTPDNCCMPQRFERILNGKIIDAIPEECEICLGSPSLKERVREFKRMFHEERFGVPNERIVNI
eukprot:jgi/Psemu1/286694/fgenesh1_pg.149_\